MASLLFALTVGVQDAEHHRLLEEEIKELTDKGVKREVAQVELALFKFSAVYFGLLAFEDVRALHGAKIDEVEGYYVAKFKQRVETSSAPNHELFLQISEFRLAAYTAELEAWQHARENGQGHEKYLAIGQTFFSFCGVQETNPVTICLARHKLITIVDVVHKTLLKYRLR